MSISDITPAGREHAAYWNDLTDIYQSDTRISTTDFHYGPLLPGDSELGLLPSGLKGKTCLELGAGAGQNSLYLASLGADCTALDVSDRQQTFGERLAEGLSLEVRFLQADMDRLPVFDQTFDLIHSAYGIPFSSDPETLISKCAEMLSPGGRLLFSMGHPVFAGEWLELDDEQGIFLQSYFQLRPDVREGEDANVQAQAYPLSEVVSWLRRAGLHLLDLREPAALPVQSMPPEEIDRRVPYYSEAWAEQHRELASFPVVAVFSAEKGAGT